MRDGHRFRSFLAMNCQIAAVAADGTEVPYSGASGTMRQCAESLQPTFWDCTQGAGPSLNNAFSVGVSLS
jgi:hypothetical protein